MSLLDRFRPAKLDEVVDTLVTLALRAARELTPKTVEEFAKRLGHRASDQDERSIFMIYAFFEYHLVDRAAAGSLESRLTEFRRAFRDRFLSQLLRFALEDDTPESDRDRARTLVNTELETFLRDFSSYSMPSGEGATMPGSIPWELGRRIARDLAMPESEVTIAPGFVGALVAIKNVDPIANAVRRLRQ